MAEYFGYEIEERDDGQAQEYFNMVEPKFHKPLAWALSELCDWYGDKAYRKLDDWYPIIYGALAMVEEKDTDPNQLALDFTQIEEKE